MPKRGISVTLRDDNLLWLKSRTMAAKKRSLSETLDDLVTAARAGGSGPIAGVKSVAGTIDISDDDPGLEKADDHIRGLVRSSLTLPVLVREALPDRGAAKPGAKRRRRG